MLRTMSAAVLAVATCWPVLASAAPGCAVPPGVGPAPAFPPPAGQVVQGVKITHEILSLTWAPEWCRTNGSKPDAATECADRSRGFVVHGLWPNGDSKPYPRFCSTVGPIDPATFAQAWCLSPSASLLQHEWEAHGSCGWSTAAAYFGEEAALRNALTLPDLDRLPTPVKTAGDVRAAFVAANPTLDQTQVAVLTDRKQRLQEVHVCYGLDFKPMTCSHADYGAPNRVAVRVTPRAG
jgi:ribonuclease T2